MDITAKQIEKLNHTAISEFKMAADRGVVSPIGMAIMLRSQIIFTAHNAPASSGRDITEQCLFHPHELVSAAMPREEIPPCLEIAAICISQLFNPDKAVDPQVDEVIKRKLAASPLSGDGQIVHVVHPYRDVAMSFKL